MLKIVTIMFLTMLSGCVVYDVERSFYEERQAQESRKQAATQRRQAQKINANKIQEKTLELRSQCKEQFSLAVDIVSCISNGQLQAAAELGLPMKTRQILAEGGKIGLKYAREIDQGTMSKVEADAQYRIEVTQLASRLLSNTQRKTALNSTSSASRSLTESTTCHDLGGMIRCSTF